MSNEFDVIVVGSGMSGGWAAKEFCEKGYKTLVLDRGKPLEHGEYDHEGKAPWEMANRGRVNQDDADRDHAITKKCYAFSEYTKQHFINDRENPYDTVEGKDFDWIRSSRVGGKSLLWHRHSYRFSEMDFAANKKDGIGGDWPIRYKDIDKWYDYVERFAGISGGKEGLPQLPDGVFQKPHDMNDVEKVAKKKIETAFPGRKVIMGRCAHLTEPTEEQLELGRGLCQSREECQRGCSWGGYFSSLAATLPAARRTGNLTLQANSAVHSVVYDAKTGRASGVKVVDTVSKKTRIIKARVIFMCASTLGTTQILLNSRSAAYENGIGNTSGVLGHYLMDHVMGSGADGRMEGFDNVYYKGRRPTSLYIPRFVNVTEENDNFKRGFAYQAQTSRGGWQNNASGHGIGPALKARINKPGGWTFHLGGFGEMLPDYNNRVFLNHNKLDLNGIPTLTIDCAYGENEQKMKEAMKNEAIEMLKAAGAKDIVGFSKDLNPGLTIHEVGTARMGADPKESYLNKFNQSHEVPNLFVTDGASFASVACQNPSLTFMAITARAVDYADSQLKAGSI